MQDTLKNLQLQRANLIAENRKLVDAANADGRTDLNSEEEEQYQKRHEAIIACERSASREKDLQEQEASLQRSAGRKALQAFNDEKQDIPSTSDILKAWALGGSDAPQDENVVGFCRSNGINLNANNFDFAKLHRLQRNAAPIVKGVSADGGYVSPPTFIAEVTEKMKYYFPVRSIVSLMPTSNGVDIDKFLVDDTSNTGALYDEFDSETFDDTQKPTFSKVTMKAFKYHSGIQPVSWEELADSFVNFDSLLADMLALRITNVTAPLFWTTGNGTTGPESIISGATKGATLSGTGISTTTDFDKCIDLVHSVSIAYRTKYASSLRFCCNDSTIASLRKLKNTYDQYIWQDGNIQTGTPDRLLSYPVNIVNEMDELGGANKKVLLFGGFGSYTIRDVTGSMQLYRLVEAYASQGATGFGLWHRMDGRYTDHKLAVKYLETAPGS